jgi:hypothetical protein
MIKDYSQLPANKRIVNDKDEDITISLRDKCIMVPVTIKVNESLSVKATTSEDLALINKQCEEFELPLEDEGPDITDIVVTITPNIREGEDNSKANATIATLSLKGGTEPVEYTLSGTDADKFILEDNIVKAKNDLVEGTYSITLSALDSTKETYSETDEINVLAAYPEITSFTVSPTSGLEEGNANVQADAVVATMSVEGGSAPITYSFKEDELNGADNASFKVEGTQLKVNTTPLVKKDYKVSLKVTDKNNKTATKNITVSVGTPAISALNITPVESLQAPLAENTVVANLSSVGGIAPYTYSLKADTQDNAEFTIEGTTVKNIASIDTAGTKNITVIVTDKNSTTKEQTAQIEISAASE